MSLRGACAVLRQGSIHLHNQGRYKAANVKILVGRDATCLKPRLVHLIRGLIRMTL